MTGAHEAVLGYSDLFRITLHGDDVQEFANSCCQSKMYPQTILWKVCVRCECGV